MRFAQEVLIVVIKLLIAIGDFVLLIFSTLFSIAIKFIGNIKKSVSNARIRATRTYKNLVLNTQNYFKKLFLGASNKVSSTKLNILKIKKIKINFPRIKFPKLKIRSFKKPKEIELFRAPVRKVSPQPFALRHQHKSRGRPRKQIFIPGRFKFKYFLFGAVFTFIFIFMPLLSLVFIQSLPNPSELGTQDIAQSTKIYDRNGTLLYQIYANQNRTLVPLSEIPENLKNATIAIEDKNYYNNIGIDITAIIRSAIADLSGKPLQGGSTITQQLIKARLLSPKQNIDRKIKEVILSLWAERIYTKDQILEMYFNQVPYGGTAWGAQVAAQTYFGRDVKDLNLAQSAFLAGLPQAPSTYSPYSGNTNLWKPRQKDVLKKMVAAGYISEKQAKDAEAEKLTFQPVEHILRAPYFVMYVRDLLEKKYGVEMVERGGLSVITSLDLDKQAMAEKVVSEEVAKNAYLNINNGAALITNPKNGDVLAMVGGKNYYDPGGGNYNVTTALRQPGSTIKVVTYTAALMNGFTAATTILDAPIAFASAGSTPYAPVNYDGKFHGNLTLRLALGNSINIPAVKTLNAVGIEKMMNLAKQMGVSTWGEPNQYGLAITLGAAEVKMTDLATVYGTLANQGNRVDLNPILKITDYQGNILEEKDTIEGINVVPSSIAFIISNILADNSARVLEFGSNSPLVIPGHNVSVKTGTTDNKRDNWTIGYTPSYLTAVWVGNNDNTPLNPALASGITGAAPIWHRIMASLLENENNPSENISQPSDVVTKNCLGRTEYFVKGTENSINCRFIPRTSPTPKP